MSTTRVPYPGTTPSANGAVHVIFATVAVTGTGSSFPNPGWPENMFDLYDFKRHNVRLQFARAGTINCYKSPDRGATWYPIKTQALSPAVAGTPEDVTIDVVVEGLEDYKMEFVNGATAQEAFVPDQVLDTERSPTV